MSLLDNNGLSYFWGKIKSYVGGQLPSDFTGATTASAGAHGLVPAPTTTDKEKFLRGDGSWGDGGKPMVVLSYGNSTWNDFIEAYNNHVIVYCKASSGSNPGTGNQTRQAFMAYVNADPPTEVEFQYYRSVSSHTASQQGDQVFIYKLNKTNGWSVTTREASTKIIGGTNTTTSYSGGALTINATDTDTWRNISINGVEKLGTAKTTGSVGFINGLNTTVTYNDTNRTIQIDTDGGSSTDEKVAQNTTTANAEYRILLSGTDDDEDHVEGAYKNSGLLYNPDKKAITAGSRNASTVIGEYSSAFGYSCQASGDYSHAEGYGTMAVENFSHSEGNWTQSLGTGSHTEGAYTTATGMFNHAEGYNTYTSGSYSHAEGRNTQAIGNNGSHAEGYYTTASGYYTHVEGEYTYATGVSAHAEGGFTTASGNISHAEGFYTKAIGSSSHAEGYADSLKPHEASGQGSHVEGYGTSAACNIANGKGSHAEGYGTYAQGDYSHAEGQKTIAKGNYSHAEGSNTYASDSGAHAEGYASSATGNLSHAESRSLASANCSHAEGEGTTAAGSGSHAEGSYTKATAYYAHSEGYGTTASGNGAHAEGQYNLAQGAGAHAEGNYTTAIGLYSHTEGYNTQATHLYQHVFGVYNLLDTSSATSTNKGNYVEIVGNGQYGARSNARTLDWDGNETISGILTDMNGKQSIKPITYDNFQQLSQAEKDNGLYYDIYDADPSMFGFDKNVKQLPTTTDANYEILFSNTADNTERTEETRKTSSFIFNPYESKLTLKDNSGRVKLSVNNTAAAKSLSVSESDITLSGNNNFWDGTNTSLKTAITDIKSNLIEFKTLTGTTDGSGNLVVASTDIDPSTHMLLMALPQRDTGYETGFYTCKIGTNQSKANYTIMCINDTTNTKLTNKSVKVIGAYVKL